MSPSGNGALSSSTLKEASSWGKVDTVWEQMVYSEATLAFPLIVLQVTGSAVAWIATMGPNRGIAEVRVDGGTPVLVEPSVHDASGHRRAYVADPDGHYWEVAWNPFADLT